MDIVLSTKVGDALKDGRRELNEEFERGVKLRSWNKERAFSSFRGEAIKKEEQYSVL